MTHLIIDDKNLCGDPGEGVTLTEATEANGRHFDCSKCMRIFSNNQKHVRPPDD